MMDILPPGADDANTNGTKDSRQNGKNTSKGLSRAASGSHPPTTTTNSARSTPSRGTSANPPNSTSLPSRTKTGGQASSTNGATTQNNASLPLSAMVSPPLDLTTVERRGQPTASEPGSPKIRPYGIEDAPIYNPTDEEWKDPYEYMRKISTEASKYGICKIIPPTSWNPPFSIDTTKFHFQTRKQQLNSVEGGSRINLTYLEGLFKFHQNVGNPLSRLPFVDKKPLDLYQLKKAVESRGGFDMVCKLKKWAEIGRDLGYSGKIMSSLSTSLKNSYQKWLCPYEEYLAKAKPGVHQQLELEYGGPFAVTPSPGASPIKHSNTGTPSSLRGDSPTRHTSDALQMALGSAHATPVTAGNTPPPSRATAFSAIKTASRNGSPLASEKMDRSLAPAHPLKRQIETDPPDITMTDATAETEGEEDGSTRRSKRLKKESIPRVAGSNMSQQRVQPPRIPRDEVDQPWERCEQCGKGESAANGFLIVCESCDFAYHGKCLDPPVATKPTTEWNCPRCLVGDGQYGFEDGGFYSLKQFHEKAEAFKADYFENKMPTDGEDSCHRPITEEDVEREFWRLVSSIDDNVEVEYGADIHCTTHGSGFPTIERNPLDPYSTDPWNLNVLPLHSDSIFRYIKSDISGMTVPWMYVGMIFSTFCWHNEDHYAYSANYQHFGATKTWYGIPGEDAEKFENAMREAVPDLFETQPDLLFQLVTLLPPGKLRDAGVRVYAVDQRAGQMVITFPQAYHAGFNHGFNFNEAVNFAPSDWEPFGLAGVDRLQQFRRQPCFSHEELVCTAAEDVTSSTLGPLTVRNAKWLEPALQRILKREADQRASFMTRHGDAHPGCRFSDTDPNGEGAKQCPLTYVIDNSEVPEDQYQCAFCKSYTYLSQFKCNKTGTVMCLQHAGTYNCCGLRDLNRIQGEGHTLTFRMAQEDMDLLYKKTLERASLPEAWEEKYDKILDEDARPPLKALRAILHEGEKIPYDLPSLSDLRRYVDRCNHWVEEATNYIRKQQSRRKNDRTQSGARKSISGTSGANGTSGENDEKEREARKLDNIFRLLAEAKVIGFECPEIHALQQRADAISEYREEARRALANPSDPSNRPIEALLEEGLGFNVDVPEVEKLAQFIDSIKWNQRAAESRANYLSLEEVTDLIKEGHRIKVGYSDNMQHLEQALSMGEQWEEKAKELLNGDVAHYPQLEALSNQATSGLIPVSMTTLDALEQVLLKHREAHRQIIDLNNRCHNKDYAKRPPYRELVNLMVKLDTLQSKPPGTHDLEKEQKRSEDWIRRGKRIFGKTNAPLYILKSHLEYVLDRNNDCFDTKNDVPRTPGEPSSRAPSSDATEEAPKREVFCICRRPEAGMMIECEVCHEWYHGKCLKIARGKVKDDDKYTCPICDWRVKIPRDAARPDLEALIALYNDIPTLPFQPDEEQVLNDIITGALDFRDKVEKWMDPSLTSDQDAIQQRFYLRKIEGAEILLTRETNFFRQVLHKKFPVAPEAPPLIEESKSTRKPRPTKLQKLMAQHQVDDPEDLPESLKIRGMLMRRKMSGPNDLHLRPGVIPLAVANGDYSGVRIPGSNGSDGSESRRTSGAGGTSSRRSDKPHMPRQPLDRHSTVMQFEPGPLLFGGPMLRERLMRGGANLDTALADAELFYSGQSSAPQKWMFLNGQQQLPRGRPSERLDMDGVRVLSSAAQDQSQSVSQGGPGASS